MNREEGEADPNAHDFDENGVCANCGGFETPDGNFCYGHEWKKIATVEATCTEDGYDEHECVNCGDVIQVKTADKLGHDFGGNDNWVETKEATCTEAGERQAKCQNCDHVATSVIPALGHDFDENGVCANCGGFETPDGNFCYGHEWKKIATVEATCTEDGYDEHECVNCGDVIQVKTADKLGHDFGGNDNWVETKEATCTEAGEKQAKCLNCDDVKTQEIPALGHSEVIDEAVAPTCTEPGKTEGKHCSVCNEVLVAQKEVDATEHDWSDKDGECDNCGLECTHYGQTRGSCRICGKWLGWYY